MTILEPVVDFLKPTLHDMIIHMIVRLSRLVSKLLDFLLAASANLGSALLQLISSLSLSTISTQDRENVQIQAHTPAEEKVSSLSGMTAILLGAVVLLLFWASSPNVQSGTVVQLLAIGPTPQSADQVQSSATQQPQQPSEDIRLQTGTIAFTMYAGSQTDLFALGSGDIEPLRLTNHPADDQNPVWSPDGRRIAFASRRDGNWELYTLEVTTGEITRITFDLAYEAEPTWSHDGQWIAYEGYYAGNLDIYIVPADGSGTPRQLTYNAALDFSPAWIHDTVGRQLAYVSTQEGNQDIYLVSLDNPDEQTARNLTRTPTIDEDNPRWMPNNDRIVFTATENGTTLVQTLSTSTANVIPEAISQGYTPAWSFDGQSLAFMSHRADHSVMLIDEYGEWGTSVKAFTLPALASEPDWTDSALPEIPRGQMAFAATDPVLPAYTEQLIVDPATSDETTYSLVYLQPLGVIAEAPYLSDRVDGAFSALREHVNNAAGWDFLGRLGDVWWGDIDRPVEPGQAFQNWHKAGRAFDILQEYSLGSPSQIELVPEQIGPNLYWRLYVRCATQDGSLGEPLRQLPWDFNARFGEDVAAYENGGAYKESVPTGYYIDFTGIARLYGWTRVPADSSWRYNWTGVLFWQYEKRDGLDWWTAMRELYQEDELRAALGDSSIPSLEVSPTLPVPPTPGSNE